MSLGACDRARRSFCQSVILAAQDNAEIGACRACHPSRGQARRAFGDWHSKPGNAARYHVRLYSQHLCRRDPDRHIPARRSCHRSDAGHADANDRLSGGYSGGEAPGRARLDLGRRVVAVRGCAVGDRAGVSSGAGVPAARYWISLGVVAAQATSMQFMVDQAVLTDSLAPAAPADDLTCILGLIVLRRAMAPLPVYLGAGALIAVAFLMRDVIAFLAIGLGPLAIAAALVQRSRLRQLAACALVFLPLIATHVAYTQWNRARVGSAVAHLVRKRRCSGALVEAAARYTSHSIFSGSTPIDDVGRLKQGHGSGPARLLKPMQTLRCTATMAGMRYRINHEVTLAFLRAWHDHPRAMIFRHRCHISRKRSCTGRCGQSRRCATCCCGIPAARTISAPSAP